MLFEARRAGDALLAAKRRVAHGEWKDWLAANCTCSYPTAARYMQVARIAGFESLTVETFEGGLVAFLEAHSKPRQTTLKATPHVPEEFDRTDAEHAQKLHAMAERGATPNERDVAKRKLEAFAERFGMTGAEAVLKAAEVAPNVTLTPAEAAKRGIAPHPC